ncbi:MAG: Huntingtin interacting protein E-like protein [uncultured Sulfurovum sp.]|uniref:Huntingtin interacting protein E-like protein n=1 Tax=uncultured Sulfurovum sp. TaxID=269237 RepID=A0A6S6TQS9_9BACT|nr:MAG: Huntingtin interacting protein E-like protein [uncultured Sulfurovum sp.]
MIPYNPNFLEKTNIFTNQKLVLLEELNTKVSLSKFLSNKSYIEKFGMDFIHTSSKIEGNTYDKHDTYTLLEYGRTAGGKKYSDAKMILNMKLAYDKFIAEDLTVSKENLKDLHYILSDEMLADGERAMPRDGEVTIKASSYVPLATKEKLDDELNYMLSKYATIENPFNRALYIHCNLAYLQYFKDCNQRTARMMLNVSLKHDKQMVYIPNEEKIREHLVATVEYYETGSYDKFKCYFIETYKETVEAIVAVEESKEREKNEPLRGEL